MILQKVEEVGIQLSIMGRINRGLEQHGDPILPTGTHRPLRMHILLQSTATFSRINHL
jgi:hypothetical protein